MTNVGGFNISDVSRVKVTYLQACIQRLHHGSFLMKGTWIFARRSAVQRLLQVVGPTHFWRRYGRTLCCFGCSWPVVTELLSCFGQTWRGTKMHLQFLFQKASPIRAECVRSTKNCIAPTNQASALCYHALFCFFPVLIIGLNLYFHARTRADQDYASLANLLLRDTQLAILHYLAAIRFI